MSDTGRRLEGLQSLMKEIRVGFYGLIDFTNPVMVSHIDRIESEVHRRLELLESYHQNARALAEKVHASTVSSLEDDVETRAALEGRVEEFVQCKFEILRRTLPQPAEHFSSHLECPFIKFLMGGQVGDCDHSVELQNAPLAPGYSTDRDFFEAADHTKPCSVSKNVITIGVNSWIVGNHALFINGKANPIHGVVTTVSTTHIEFAPDGGAPPVIIPVMALKAKLCRLKRT
jgi:hypothetical protein